MTEEKQGGDEFTADEQAFFESGGEAELKPEGNADALPEGEAEQQPEQEVEAEPKAGERDEKGRFVPHGALHAEREEHKKTKAELEDLKQFRAVMEDRWNSLLKAGQPKEDEAKVDDDPEPDPNRDIFAHNAWLKRQFEREKQANSEWRQTQQKASDEQRQQQEIAREWQSSVQQFQAQKPDFGDAAQYLSDLRSKQLSALGLDQNAVNATINQELIGVIQQAKQAGKSPAELIYAYASVSGYQPKAQEQKNPAELPENLQKVAQAQDAAKTIAGGGGKGGNDPDSAEAIASMSEREFAAWITKPENARRFERMMGAA